MNRGRCTGLAFVCALVVALAALAVQCATDSGTLMQTYAASSSSGIIELSFPLSTEGVPLRVDYRDRDDAFDLDLLGAATGMCSFAGDCDACSYRDANPCKVIDRYGADPSLCQLPGFLGGAVSSENLCGIGATVDVTLAGSSSPAPVATLTAFRTRAGKLMLTITARCGWVLVPSENMAFNSSSSADGSSGSGAVSAAPAILEGAISYLSFDTTFTVPAEAAAAGEVERYSCYSTGLRLRGLSSRCQGLNLDLKLRFAVQRLDVISTGGSGGGGEAVLLCREAGSPVAVEARLLMRVPRARAKAAASKATLASAAASSSAKTAAMDLESRQQLFSNGVAATMSYKAFVDPRDSQAASWLQSLASQYPVVSVAPSSESLSFLVGSVRRALQSGLAAPSGDVSGATSPLLPAGLHLETCGRQAINAVVAAVVSALAAKGVTERYVSDVVCLTSPYKEVPAAELPPCAKSTSVLFNVTLEIPTSSATGVTSSLVGTLAASSSGNVLAASTRLSGDEGSGGSATDPQTLADALVGAQLAAPWACLSTEGQMRMLTRLDVDLQLPKGPGVEAVTTADTQPVPDTAPAPSPITSSPRPSSSDAPVVIALPLPRTPGPPPAVYEKSFGTAAVAAVAVAVALALVVALVAFFAIRSVRKSKAAARQAAAAARAAAAATGGGAPAPPAAAAAAAAAGKLAPPLPLKAVKALPPALEAEPSYASSCDGGVASSPASGRGAAGGLGREGSGICSSVAARVAQSPSEGVMPWGSKTAEGERLAPAASAASLEPFAAAVEAAAAASTSNLGALAASLGGAPSSAGIGVVTAADVIREEDQEEPLSSIRGGAPSTSPTPAAAATAISPQPAPSGDRGAPARILPVTPPPALIMAGGDVGGPSGAARSTASPPGQAVPRRRSRMLRLSGVHSGGLVPEAPFEGAGAAGRAGGGGAAATAGAAIVWSNALYDVPDQLYDSGGEGGDTPVAMAASASANLGGARDA